MSDDTTSGESSRDPSRQYDDSQGANEDDSGDDIERIFSGEPLTGRGRRAQETDETGHTSGADEVDLDDTEWLSTQDAARRLGITPRTLYRFIDQGDLPAYRFGRVIRLRAHEIEHFVESSRIQPGELVHLYPEPVARDEQS